LSEILRAESGEPDKKRDFDRQKKLTELNMKAIMESRVDKNGKPNVSFADVLKLAGEIK